MEKDYLPVVIAGSVMVIEEIGDVPRGYLLKKLASDQNLHIVGSRCSKSALVVEGICEMSKRRARVEENF